MDFKLELAVLPVSDVDRAKEFYVSPARSIAAGVSTAAWATWARLSTSSRGMPGGATASVSAPVGTMTTTARMSRGSSTINAGSQHPARREVRMTQASLDDLDLVLTTMAKTIVDNADFRQPVVFTEDHANRLIDTMTTSCLSVAGAATEHGSVTPGAPAPSRPSTGQAGAASIPPSTTIPGPYRATKLARIASVLAYSGPVAEIPEHEGRVSDWASEDGPPPRTSRSGSNIRPQALSRDGLRQARDRRSAARRPFVRARTGAGRQAGSHLGVCTAVDVRR